MKRGLLVVAAVFLAGTVLRSCLEKRQRQDERAYVPALKENEREKVIVDTRAGTVQRLVRNHQSHNVQGGNSTGGQTTGEETVTNLSGVRKIAVTVGTDGHVEVYAPTKGVIFEPGLAGFFSDDRFRIGLDAQVFYWRRWGVNVGAGCTLDKPYSVKAFVAGSYNIFGNTSVFVGVTQSKELGAGVHIRF